MIFRSPLTHREEELLTHLDRLKYFLATAPSRWSESDFAETEAMLGELGAAQRGTPLMPHPNTHPALNRFLLPSGMLLSLFFSAVKIFY